ncbi:hypothetical protein ACIQF6_33595 [Kitasatospora sp. NPDC092948]
MNDEVSALFRAVPGPVGLGFGCLPPFFAAAVLETGTAGGGSACRAGTA